MFSVSTISGSVRQYRLFRLHVNFGTNNYLYPYDKQTPQIKLQSTDYAEEIIKLTTKQLNTLNGVDPGRTNVTKTETTLSSATVQHENYISNSEWDWQSYNYEISPVTSVVRNGVKFSQERFWTYGTKWFDPYNKVRTNRDRFFKIFKFTIDFDLRRNQPFYSLTLFIPILVLTLLSPIGLLLPGNTHTIWIIWSISSELKSTRGLSNNHF